MSNDTAVGSLTGLTPHQIDQAWRSHHIHAPQVDTIVQVAGDAETAACEHCSTSLHRREFTAGGVRYVTGWTA